MSTPIIENAVMRITFVVESPSLLLLSSPSASSSPSATVGNEDLDSAGLTVVLPGEGKAEGAPLTGATELLGTSVVGEAVCRVGDSVSKAFDVVGPKLGSNVGDEANKISSYPLKLKKEEV